MPESRVRIVRAPPGLIWRAVDGDQVVGAVSAVLRPNGRWFVHFDLSHEDNYEPLLAAVAENTGSDLYTVVDERNKDALARFEQLGFAVNRHESVVAIATDPQVTGLHVTDEPDGVITISANDAFEDQLRLLDDALRQDIPGAEGWRWDPVDFNEETFSREFDPATYLVAVDVPSGEYIGLVRVWMNPGRPRLGLIAVLPQYRGRGLASLLLARAFRVLHERGKKEVTAEVDESNAASRSLMEKLAARRIGGYLELIRPHQSRST
ncbi:MAG: GNAT family N-acetyltransferase [Streptosporangiaceae bacterium]